MMICREWMQQNHPALVGEEYAGGVYGCPHEYGLVEKLSDRTCKNICCEDCWGRPVTNATPVSSQQEGREMHKCAVVTTSLLPVYEGSHAQCESYIDQAIRKGSEPGFLDIIPFPEVPEPERKPPVNREKLLIGLEHCRDRGSTCHTCPYYHFRYSCIDKAAGDALAYICYLEEAMGIG